MKKPYKIMIVVGGGIAAVLAVGVVVAKIDQARWAPPPPQKTDWNSEIRIAQAKDQAFVSMHKGEPTEGGLRVGMTRAEALSSRPGGQPDSRYPDVVRWQAEGRDKELVAKFVGGELATAKFVWRGQDAMFLGTGMEK